MSGPLHLREKVQDAQVLRPGESRADPSPFGTAHDPRANTAPGLPTSVRSWRRLPAAPGLSGQWSAAGWLGKPNCTAGPSAPR